MELKKNCYVHDLRLSYAGGQTYGTVGEVHNSAKEQVSGFAMLERMRSDGGGASGGASGCGGGGGGGGISAIVGQKRHWSLLSLRF
jgi:hypothetical protein